MINFYVYGHFLLTGEVFYIGKGKDGRAWYKHGRSSKWNRKVAKHEGFIVSILQDQLDEDLAFEVEQSFIQSIGLENLVNMTEGGEGVSGYKHSEEECKKRSDRSKGNKHPMYGKHHSEESRKKQSDTHIGLFDGDKNPFFGKQHSEETKEKMKSSSFMKGKLGINCVNSKKVSQYTKEGILIKIWESIMDIERELGICNSSVSQCCKCKRKTAGRFVWKYAD